VAGDAMKNPGKQIAYLARENERLLRKVAELREDLDKAHEQIRGMKEEWSVMKDRIITLGGKW
jgi:uncharacterized coiled-coil DUF342 family protein